MSPSQARTPSTKAPPTPDTVTAMSRPEYPPARRGDDADTLHGTVVADPYRWLEDVDEPETVAWSESQDALGEAARGTWDDRNRLAARVTDLLGPGSVGTPAWRGERQFFT